MGNTHVDPADIAMPSSAYFTLIATDRTKCIFVTMVFTKFVVCVVLLNIYIY